MRSIDNFAGGAAIIVPGAVSGYAYLHRRLGRLDWKNLFEPAITLSERGFNVDQHLALSLKLHHYDIRHSSRMECGQSF